MNILVRLAVSEKDEPEPGALAMTAAGVASRVSDVLSDVTKHDGMLAWRVTSAKLVEPKTAAIRQAIKARIESFTALANDIETSDSLSLTAGNQADGLELALEIIDAAIAGK